MSLQIATKTLLCCAVLNYSLLIVWCLLSVLFRRWFYHFAGKPFGVTSDQFNATNFAGIVVYKTAIIVLVLVPYVSLRIVGG